MIRFKHKGDFSKTIAYFRKVEKPISLRILNDYGRRGVEALRQATPVDSGKTASAWDYVIENQNGFYKIAFINTNVNDGVQIAIILQYGHATRTGGWVEGRDYINPAVRPVFDKLAEDAWKEVTNA